MTSWPSINKSFIQSIVVFVLSSLFLYSILRSPPQLSRHVVTTSTGDNRRGLIDRAFSLFSSENLIRRDLQESGANNDNNDHEHYNTIYNSTCNPNLHNQCGDGQFICVPVDKLKNRTRTVSMMMMHDNEDEESFMWNFGGGDEWNFHGGNSEKVTSNGTSPSTNDEGVCVSCESSHECSGYPLITCQPSYIFVEGSNTTESYVNGTIVVVNEGKKLRVHTCAQKKLMPPTWRDWTATAICFVGGALAASSGIGGGGIYVPVLILVAGYTPQFAVPISTVMIFGASIANVALLAPKKHPVGNRPLIDYASCLLLQPIILCGTTLGVMLNVILPNWLLVVLLFALLIVSAYRSFVKGLSLSRKEKQERMALMAAQQEQNNTHTSVDHDEASINDTNGSQLELRMREDDETPLPETTDDHHHHQTPHVFSDHAEMSKSLPELSEVAKGELVVMSDEREVLPREDELMLQQIEKRERAQFPFLILFLLAVAWIIVGLLSVLKGSKKIPSFIGVRECSASWWTLNAIQYPIMFLFSAIVGLFLHMEYKKKVRLNYNFLEGDIRWNLRNVTLVPLLFLSAGITAGLLGIGGGMVTGPLLLELGLNAQVVVATSAFMIFFTGSSTVAQFAFLGSMPVDYSLWYAAFGLVSGAVGQLVISMVISKLKRTSLVIYTVAICIAVSSVLMFITGTMSTVKDYKAGKSMGFKKLC